MSGLGITSDVVRQCLYTLDIPDEEVNVEDVRMLLGLLPTPEEEQVLKAYKGPRDQVGRAEQYFLELMDIPRYKQRVNCFLYKMKFDEAYEDVNDDYLVLKDACDQVLESKRLRRLLEIVLALGNFMNEGEDAPRTRLAEGFHIEALNKLRQVKSFQMSTTALHYLAMLIQSREAQLIGYIKSETDVIRKAANVSLTNAQSQLQILENGIRAVENEHKHVSKIVDDPEQHDKLSEDDKAFIVGLSKFHMMATKALADLRKLADDTEARFKETLEYFLEDAATTSEVLFRMLQSFFADFELALNQNDAARQKHLKRQRAKHERDKKKDEPDGKKPAAKGKGRAAAGSGGKPPVAPGGAKSDKTRKPPGNEAGKAKAGAGESGPGKVASGEAGKARPTRLRAASSGDGSKARVRSGSSGSASNLARSRAGSGAGGSRPASAATAAGAGSGVPASKAGAAGALGKEASGAAAGASDAARNDGAK